MPAAHAARVPNHRRSRRAQIACALLVLLAGLAVPVAGQGPAACVRCGSERWAVKTLSDRDRAKVSPRPVNTTIGELGSLAMPRHRPDDARLGPTELTTFRIRAVVVGWKGESDQDFHLVVADRDDPLETMIVEVPSPGCAGVCTSGKVRDMARVRQTVLDHLGPVPNGRLACLAPEPMVTVTGVGFFDRPHRQTGRAPNAIELHPVLDLRFDDPPTAVTPRRVSCRTGAPIRQRGAVVFPGEGGAPATSRAPRGRSDQQRSDSAAPAGASARCRDGTYSFSAHRRGTCSHHGGVAQWL